MKYLSYALVMLILFSLNMGMFPYLEIFSGTPNLLMLFVIALSVESKDYDFIVLAFLSGLFLDFYTDVAIGSFSVGFMLLGILIQYIAKEYLVLELNWKYLLGLMVAGYVFVYAFVWVYGLCMYRFGLANAAVELPMLQKRILPELFYNAVLLYPLYWVTDLMREFILRNDRRRYSN
jgi:rod shape-determining protein MreD